MKAMLNIRHLALIILGSGLLTMSPQAQAQEQFKARISVDYFKVMGENAYIQISAKYKEDKKYHPASGLEFNVYREVDEDSVGLVGKAITDLAGNAQFALEAQMLETVDSAVEYTYIVKIEDDEKFKDAKKAVSFMKSTLIAEAIEDDSTYFISAQLTDAAGDPIKAEKLKVMVKRLFAPLTIGKSSYKTNSKGRIRVPLDEPLPGVDGILTFMVELDSKEYGIVQAVFEAPIGEPVVDRSTFDQRTMWSPPGKTPLFLLIFPNLVILGIWAVMILLVRNLYIIYKS